MPSSGIPKICTTCKHLSWPKPLKVPLCIVKEGDSKPIWAPTVHTCNKWEPRPLGATFT